ncbi:MAG: molecular chaperone TorD family protein [Acidobacteriota bacterium]|nr:MAG: molecular chaperone TorD family protein [Acidobacteriota bacterium]
MSATTAELNDARALVGEALAWRLMGLLLERPRNGWKEQLLALARETRDPQLREAAQHAEKADEPAYLRVLGPGGTVSPREVGHRPYHDPGQILADIRAFYEAFGFRPRAEDPIDHVAVEAGFVGYLYLKLAYATENSLSEQSETTRRGIDAFARAHLGGFAAPFASRIAASPVVHLARTARAVSDRLAQRGLLSKEPSRPGHRIAREKPARACRGCEFLEDET